MSVAVGGDADDQCECASGALSDAGECGKGDNDMSVIDADAFLERSRVLVNQRRAP